MSPAPHSVPSNAATNGAAAALDRIRHCATVERVVWSRVTPLAERGELEGGGNDRLRPLRCARAVAFILSAAKDLLLKSINQLEKRILRRYAPQNDIDALLPVATLIDLNRKRSEWNPKFGIGAGYDFSSGLGLRLVYERVSNVGDARTGDGNVGMWSLGLTKRY